MKSIELVLVIVVSAIIAGYIISYLIPLRKVEPKEITFDALREILVNLNNFKEFSLPSEAVVEVKPAVLSVNGLEFNATQVKLVWRLEGPVLSGYRGEVWSLWCNQTYVGVESWVKVFDDGLTLEVIYFDCSAKTLRHVSYSEVEVVFRGTFRDIKIYFNGIEVYQAEGFRKLVIKKVSCEGGW